MTINAQYAGTCAACGCRFPAGSQIEWTRGVGARHVTITECEAAKRERDAAKAKVRSTKLDLTSITKFLGKARERGLKFPKLRVLAPDCRTELRLSLTVHGQAPGSVAVKLADEFYGCVRPDGAVVGKLASDDTMQKHLVLIAEDPAKAAKTYAALMCKCSFCNLPLTDEGSVEVGYGPICAQHWGLPHKAIGTPALAPARPLAATQEALDLFEDYPGQRIVGSDVIK